MTLDDLKTLWASWIGGPEILFAVRISVVVPVLIYAAMKLYEFTSPLHRHPLQPPREAGMWRWLALLTAICAIGYASYFFIAAWLEQDRGGTPLRYVYGNAWNGLLFWFLCLQTFKKRKESWERKYLSEGY